MHARAAEFSLSVRDRQGVSSASVFDAAQFVTFRIYLLAVCRIMQAQSASTLPIVRRRAGKRCESLKSTVAGGD